MHHDVIMKHIHIHQKLLKLETGELNRGKNVYPTREEDREKEIFCGKEFAYRVRIIICDVSHFLPKHSCLVMVRDGIRAWQTPGTTSQWALKKERRNLKPYK